MVRVGQAVVFQSTVTRLNDAQETPYIERYLPAAAEVEFAVGGRPGINNVSLKAAVASLEPLPVTHVPRTSADSVQTATAAPKIHEYTMKDVRHLRCLFVSDWLTSMFLLFRNRSTEADRGQFVSWTMYRYPASARVVPEYLTTVLS